MTTPTPPRTAWVQLYEARRVSSIPVSRAPGRPPASIPRRKVGLTLAQGEISEIEEWQERFSGLLKRKVSEGETVGILVRICTARLNRVGEAADIGGLAAFVEKLIEGE
jgi:hypothetical protein